MICDGLSVLIAALGYADIMRRDLQRDCARVVRTFCWTTWEERHRPTLIRSSSHSFSDFRRTFTNNMWTVGFQTLTGQEMSPVAPHTQQIYLKTCCLFWQLALRVQIICRGSKRALAIVAVQCWTLILGRAK